MASSAIDKVIAGYDRMKLAAKNAKIREHVQQQNMWAMGSALVGAAAAGVIDAKYNADGSSKKTTAILAGVGIIAGVGGVFDYVPGGLVIGMGGVGILCYLVGKVANQKYKEHAAAAA